VRPNLVKEKWRRGEVAYGAWLTIPSAYPAEIVAHAGYDWACVDMQHGHIGYGDAVTMLLALSTTDTMAFVRVPWNEPGIIGKVLDAGAMGVIIPMTNSAEETRAAVAACLYPPLGSRSYGPGRAALYGGPGYFDGANDEIAVVPMIETKEALGALDEILSVPRAEAVLLGPSDMSISLGMRPGLQNPGAWEEAWRRIAEACERHGVVAGVYANAALAAKHAAAGYRMIAVTNDATALAQSAARDLAVVRAGGAVTAPPPEA
jgi:4-hydroxy-2-oxoheptanedioate aldolase